MPAVWKRTSPFPIIASSIARSGFAEIAPRPPLDSAEAGRLPTQCTALVLSYGYVSAVTPRPRDEIDVLRCSSRLRQCRTGIHSINERY